MRRLTKIGAASAVLALALAGCAQDEEGPTPSAQEDLCDGGGDGPKVGLAYDVGGRGDQSFNDSAAVGMQKAIDEVSAGCTEAEAQDGEAESAREDRLRALAEDGHNPIIGIGFAYSDSANLVAPDFPEVSFAVIDGFDPDEEPNDNVAYLGFAEHEGSFLVGVAAALTTEADHVGFVGGVNVPLIQKFEAGYVAGVAAVDKAIQVDVQYIEESEFTGFNDPAGGKAAATAIYDKGADVVYHAAGGSGSGVFDAAVEAGDGMWAIGVDSDQYLLSDASVQPYILTSMLKKVEVAVYDTIERAANGEDVAGANAYDLSSGGVDYATSGGFVDDIADQLDDLKQQIIDGEIEVPQA